MSGHLKWVIIAIVEKSPGSREEVILGRGDISPYSPGAVEAAIEESAIIVEDRVDELKRDANRVLGLQISLRPVLDNDALRPSFSLSEAAIEKLKIIGVSLDFDPY